MIYLSLYINMIYINIHDISYIYTCSDNDRAACPKPSVPGLGVGFKWNYKVLMQTIILLVHIEGMDWQEAGLVQVFSRFPFNVVPL